MFVLTLVELICNRVAAISINIYIYKFSLLFSVPDSTRLHFWGSSGMEQTNIESRLLQARSAVCLTNLKALTEFCDHVGIEKQGVGTGAGHTHQSNKGSGQMVRRGVLRRKQRTHCSSYPRAIRRKSTE